MAYTFWEAPEPVHPVDSFKLYQSITTQPPPKATHSKGGLRRHQSLLKKVLLCAVGPCTADPPQQSEVSGQWSQLALAADRSGGKSLLLMCQ